MSRLCHNCIIESIILFQIIIQYYEEDINNTDEFNETPTVDFLQSVFVQLETIISQVKNNTNYILRHYLLHILLLILYNPFRGLIGYLIMLGNV